MCFAKLTTANRDLICKPVTEDINTAQIASRKSVMDAV